MNYLKKFNEELYKNCDRNKCQRCGTILGENNQFDMISYWKDDTTGVDVYSSIRTCRHCVEEVMNLLTEHGFVDYKQRSKNNDII